VGIATSGEGAPFGPSGRRGPWPGRKGAEGTCAGGVSVIRNPFVDLSLVARPETAFVMIVKDGVIRMDALERASAGCGGWRAADAGLCPAGDRTPTAPAPERDQGDSQMAFELPPLPYSHDALADAGMSKETLEFHHDIHHKAYVDNGNKAISGTEWEGKPVEEIVKGTYQAGAVAQSGIFNNASQHWNHSQFWEMMTPGTPSMPSELEKRIADAFGSVDAFKEKFSAAGAGQFGSGWAWLVKDGDELKVTSTENGVNPLCFGQHALLGCDVWEHSYYIDFRNKRPAYLQNFLDNLANWENVAERLDKAGG